MADLWHALVIASSVIALLMGIGLMAAGLRFAAVYLNSLAPVTKHEDMRDPVLGTDQVTQAERNVWMQRP